ncbi:MAG: hypothetical protein ACRD50_16590 [Candidatus Acidiferrales bacterium]
MKRVWVAAVALLLLLTTAMVASAQNVSQGTLRSGGTVFLQAPSSVPAAPTTSTSPQVADREPELIRLMHGSAQAPAVNTYVEIPRTFSNARVVSGGTALTFNGIDAVDSATQNGFDVVPPDQGLCAGNGQILELVNLALNVYSESGSEIVGPLPLSDLFGTGSDFISDPRCYYDQATNIWFSTVTDLNDSCLGGFESSIRISVSNNGDLSQGFLEYALPTGDDGSFGTPIDPGCGLAGVPCFGDQPLIGANTDGFYISTNEFSEFFPFFNGAQIYALSKAGLELGTATFQHLNNLTVAGETAASVSPASSPGPNVEPNGGTEFFMSSLNFNGTSANHIALWAMTNTSSLNTLTPDVSLENKILRVKAYEEPGAASQEVGPIPLGAFFQDPEGTLSPDDNRMQQVVFTGEHLYSAITTTIFDGTEFVDGIETFVLEPGFNENGKLKAELDGNRYVTVKGQNLIYPAIGVTANDEGVMTFTLTGPNFFPTAAFIRIDDDGAFGPVHVAAAGGAPEDDFSDYARTPSDIVFTGRWGDYSAAVADGNTNIFIATEYVSNVRRDFASNWATSISQVTVPDPD